MRKPHLLSLIGIAVLVAACGGGFDLGGIDLGEILGSTGPGDGSVVEGAVLTVNTGERRIDLDVNYINNLRDDRANSSIWYREGVQVEYQNEMYPVSALERGDVIRVEGENQNGQFLASAITLVRNVRG